MGRYRRIGWLRRPGRRRPGDRRTRRSSGSASPTGPTTASAPCPAGSASGCCSPARSRRTAGCCSSTSRSTASTAPRPGLLLDVLGRLRADGRGRRDVHPRPRRSPTWRASEACLLNRRQVAFGPIERGAHRRARCAQAYGGTPLTLDGGDARHRRPALSGRSCHDPPADRTVPRRRSCSGRWSRRVAARRARRRRRGARAAAPAGVHHRRAHPHGVPRHRHRLR